MAFSLLPPSLRRLQEEILKESSDQNLLAWGHGMSLQVENKNRSLLASSPRFFAHGAELRQAFCFRRSLDSDPIAHSHNPMTHSQITNRGLYITLRFYPTFPQEPAPGISRRYIALLACQHASDSIMGPSRQAAMYIEVSATQIRANSNTFEHDTPVRRVRTSCPFMLSQGTLDML